MKYNLSIIIPTRNRHEYLLKCIEQILNNTSEKVQVVVQDNSDKPIRSEMEAINIAERVKYNYCSHQLSFVDNFSQALSLSEGEYVMYIGDDDGVLPIIEKYVQKMVKNSIEILVPTISFEYFWPNSVYIKGKIDGVIRLVPQQPKMTMINAAKQVQRLVKNGGLDYTYMNLAKVYHGIVKRSLFEEIYEKTGVYFGGLTPDIYMAVVLSLVSKSVYYSNEAFTIAGVCPGSGSAQSSLGIHHGKYESAPHLVGHEKYDWSDLVAKFYSVETIWADSAVCAIKNLGYTHILEDFNYSRLTGRLLSKYPDFSTEIMCCYNRNNKNVTLISKLKSPIDVFVGRYNEYFFRIIGKIKRYNKKVVIISGISDISEATEYYNNLKGDKNV